MAHLTSVGALRPHDHDHASWQLFSLCLGEIHLRLLLGLLQDLPQVALETQRERAVDAFLVLYGPIGPDR